MLSIPLASADDGGRRTIHVERQIGDVRVTVLEYQEQFGDFVPDFGRRRWRTLLCVEVLDNGAARPRRVWQNAMLGKTFHARSFVLSDAVNGHFFFAFCLDNTVMVGLVALNGKVEPLPEDFQLDPQTIGKNWKNSPLFPIPQDDALIPIGEREIGMKLTYRHVLSLQSATKTDGGWRIDAQVHDADDTLETILPGGAKLMQRNPRPVRRFAVLLDEECKSAKFEVVK
jgi:hypothetical protein